MSNLDTWNKHADIDPQFTKPITGKAYKGTSPSPQHVVWCLTELFGPIGQGWGAHVVAEGFQPLGDEILHWCRVEFWHGDRAQSFQTYGQTKALMKTRNGMMSDEDAPKKSFTDALVKAASYLGVAANIFLGRWDDQKYVAAVADDFKRKGAPEFDPAAARDRIKGAIEKARTLPDLKKVWATERQALAQISDAKPPMFKELEKAKDDRKNKLTGSDPAMQAPPQDEGQHAYA